MAVLDLVDVAGAGVAAGTVVAYQMPALGHGVRSSLSLPLHTDCQTLGALNIHATQPRVFGPPEQLIAQRFADEASRALALAVPARRRAEMSAAPWCRSGWAKPRSRSRWILAVT